MKITLNNFCIRKIIVVNLKELCYSIIRYSFLTLACDYCKIKPALDRQGYKNN